MEKVGHRLEHTLLALGGCSFHAMGKGISGIDRLDAGRTRCDWGYRRRGHVFSGENGERVMFLLRRGRRSRKVICFDLMNGGWCSGYRALTGVVGRFVGRAPGLIRRVGN